MTAESGPSNSHIKRFRPYFTPSEVESLSSKQRGKLSVSREERDRQKACRFIDAVGVRCGFPRKTTATAQTLYMRFHLYFPYKDFNYIPVSLSALYVSSKLHDTLKKPRDIILASYVLRFPQLVKKGAIDPAAVDGNMLEGERRQVLNIERLVLETMCFKFGVEVAFPSVIKLARKIGLDSDLAQHGWRVAVDCYRTPVPLSYPPHVIALASHYTAMLLLSEATKQPAPSDQPELAGSSAVKQLGERGAWEEKYSATALQVDDIAHALLDLYVTILSTPSSESAAGLSSLSPVSPKDPASAAQPQNPPQHPALSTAFRLPPHWTTQTLTELKIHLRDRRPGDSTVALPWAGADDLDNGQTQLEHAVDGMGQNDGTIRFLWD